MKKNLQYIRDDFNKRFKQLAKEEGLKISNEFPWPDNLPLDDLLLAGWQSDDLMKMMGLHEFNEDETLQFDYVVEKAGINDEYDNLMILATNANEITDLIFELYKLWFIENKPPTEIEGILESYFKKLNP